MKRSLIFPIILECCWSWIRSAVSLILKIRVKMTRLFVTTHTSFPFEAKGARGYNFLRKTILKLLKYFFLRRSGGMVDAVDSKSTDGNIMGVQVPSPVPGLFRPPFLLRPARNDCSADFPPLSFGRRYGRSLTLFVFLGVSKRFSAKIPQQLTEI